MTQEQKELVLKDLCGRLPYGVKCQFEDTIEIIKEIWFCEDEGWQVDGEKTSTCIHAVKPYLFPLSSMTDELWDKEFRGYGITEFTRDSFKYGCETLEFNNCNPNLLNMVGFINQLIRNHFDIYGLIPMGLANDATGKNIY